MHMSLWDHSPDLLFILNPGELKATVTSTATRYLGFMEKQEIFTFRETAWGVIQHSLTPGTAFAPILFVVRSPRFPSQPRQTCQALHGHLGLSVFLLRFSPELLSSGTL